MLTTLQRKEACGLYWLKHCGSWFGFTEPAEFKIGAWEGGGFFASVATGDLLYSVARNGRTEPSDYPLCTARDADGPYQREARTIAELPAELRAPALKAATAEVARISDLIPVGLIEEDKPVYEAFGLTRTAAMQHLRASVLGKLGSGLALGAWYNARA